MIITEVRICPGVVTKYFPLEATFANGVVVGGADPAWRQRWLYSAAEQEESVPQIDRHLQDGLMPMNGIKLPLTGINQALNNIRSEPVIIIHRKHQISIRYVFPGRNCTPDDARKIGTRNFG